MNFYFTRVVIFRYTVTHLMKYLTYKKETKTKVEILRKGGISDERTLSKMNSNLV